MVRVKNRYLVVNFLYPEPAPKSKTQLPDLVQIHAPTPDALKQGFIVRMIRDGVEELFGDYGAGMVSSGLKVNYYSPSTSTAIIRCPRDHYEMVWAALTYTTRLPRPLDTPVVIRVVRVSGTIKKAEEEVIRRSQQIVKRAKAWDGAGQSPMLQSVEKVVDKERKNEVDVLASIDNGSESEDMSE
ncbi:ribonuclease p mrp protein subunit [Stemphylium lycopersici]|uniref:Ribonuclease P/MRP protein subunit POP5 n=1 Tax=Stemphylium lycopersici TaxID=183478 RepID=A0A364N1Z5_STELY|nr:ribonuclease p mrp protein subunit [Stemphylium lycopersici]